MASNISSAQLHVTFDVGDKHGGIFTYAEILRKVFDIFIISVGSCMHYMFVQKGDYLFYSDMASMIIYKVKKCLGAQLQGTASYMNLLLHPVNCMSLSPSESICLTFLLMRDKSSDSQHQCPNI